MPRLSTKIGAKDAGATDVGNVGPVTPPERAVGVIATLPTVTIVAARRSDGSTDDDTGDTSGDRSTVTVATPVVAATAINVPSAIIVSTNSAIGISEAATSHAPTTETATALACDLMYVCGRSITGGCRCRHRRCYNLCGRCRADCRRRRSCRRCACARHEGNYYGSGELSHMSFVWHLELLFHSIKSEAVSASLRSPCVSGCPTQPALCVFPRVARM